MVKAFLKKIISQELIDTLWHAPRAVCASIFFRFPARSLTCIAVAGTKGKTSTSYFLYQILKHSGIQTALFSTALVSLPGNETLNTWKMTTPNPFSLQQFLRRAGEQGCTHAVIEVSSHALKQNRVWGIPFPIAVITNLTPDHLDYHSSASDYIDTHHALIHPHLKHLVINAGDPNSTFFTTLPNAIDFSHDEACKISVASLPQWWAPLQQSNICAAVTAAQALNVSNEKITQALPALVSPPGRFEEIHEGQPFRVLVDYAHSPESLHYFFEGIKPLTSGSLFAVFGACGDRDKKVRHEMGSILERYTHHTFLTTDDPYSENPEDIAKMVERGFSTKEKFTRVLDRKTAIEQAFLIAKKDDCVCILGKGAEQWQIFRDKKIPWDDRNITRTLLDKQRKK